MKISFSPPDITSEEIDAVVDVLRSGWITTGPKTKQFERELSLAAGTSRTVCLNSATAALEMTLRLLGIGPGDEVIVPAYTYSASASVVCHVGAKLVLVDIPKDSFHIDAAVIQRAITPNTKAVIPVDIGGVMCDYKSIFEMLEDARHLFHPANDFQSMFSRPVVIADAAHSFGATTSGIPSGSAADFSCFSFHAVKNLTTAEGGAVTWRSISGMPDDLIYRNLMIDSLHGQTKDAFSKNLAGSWEYDILVPGHKCNMTDIMASIGLVQLKRYPALLKRRKELIKRYNTAFQASDIRVMRHDDSVDYFSSGHLYMTRLNGKDCITRNHIIQAMAKYGIATNVHYKPLPLLTAYKNLGFDIENFPNAYAQFQNEISLPLYSKMTNEQQDYVIEKFNCVIKES